MDVMKRMFNERQCRVCGRTFFPAVEADAVNAESQRRRVERRQKTIAARR